MAHRRVLRRHRRAYTQALRAAARDGVDVRLLVPGASDVPAISPLSRAGYRALLEAGVRVFEWNGTMLHAKTAVADRRWSRVGSTNLNLVSWMSNYELDVAIEDAAIRRSDGGAVRARPRAIDGDRAHEPQSRAAQRAAHRELRSSPEASGGARRAMSGSAGRAAAGAVSVGSALGAALTNRRTLGPAEAGLLVVRRDCSRSASRSSPRGSRACSRGRVAVLCGWLGVSWAWKAWTLWRKSKAKWKPPEPTPKLPVQTRGEERSKARIVDSSRP